MSNKMEKLEFLFKELISAKDKLKERAILNSISEFTKKTFNIDSVVNIIEENDEFFGFRIYPSTEALRGQTIDIIKILNKDGSINKLKFSKATDVLIEIQRASLKLFSEKELVAIYLHEIGHKAIENEIPKIVMYNLIKNLGSRGIVLLMSLPILNVSILLYALLSLLYEVAFSIALRSLYDVKESKADELAVRYGYGRELESVLIKISDRFYGKDSLYNISLYKIIFSSDFNTIKHLVSRKKELEKMIDRFNNKKNRFSIIEYIKKCHLLNVMKKEDVIFYGCDTI